MPTETASIVISTSSESIPIFLTDAEFGNLLKGFDRALHHSDGSERDDVLPALGVFDDLKGMAVSVAETDRPLRLDESSLPNFTACLVLIEGKNVLTATQKRLFKRLIKELGQGEQSDTSDVVEFGELEKAFDPANLN